MVHVFGNRPSSALETLGLRKTADTTAKTFGSNVKEYIYQNLCMDDTLSLHKSAQKAITLLKKAQKALPKEGNIRLHKLLKLQ